MKVDQRRRLTDLYARGEAVNVAPTSEEPYMVWVRKMTPADAEIAYLKAGARRASTLALEREEPPSDLYLTLKGEVDLLSRENLIVWVASSTLAGKKTLIEARVAGEEEWAKERYLILLQERFSDPDFLAKLTETPEDPEVVRVSSELARYREAVNKEIEYEQGICMSDAEYMDDESLRHEVMQSMIGTHADAAWLNEFQRCQVWRCSFLIEGTDHTQRLFNSREEVDEEQVEVTNILKAAIDRIHVGDVEGKDSQQTQDSLLASA